jgi:two-component system chemotaxis response regulator CheB
MRQLCDDDPRLTVVGEATNGRQAIELVVALRPAIVVMDIEMPLLDGIEATRQIMTTLPTPILIVTAHYDAGDVALSLRAVHAGALNVLHKPGGPGSPSFRQDAERFVRMVKALSGVRPMRRYSSGLPPAARAAVVDSPVSEVPLRAVGVAASTGGPAAVYRLLELLPVPLHVPVMVVQHIADGFAPGLALWLDAATPLRLRLARHGDVLQAGTIYIAPERRHLTAGPAGEVVLVDEAPVAGFRPSATVLFQSLAAVYGPAAVGIVLTGMGSDGLEGARALRAAGAAVLAQDADSSVVFGMPRAVAEAGLATSVGTVEQLAQTLRRTLQGTR